MKRYLLAHDLGTSGNKATLFTTEGALVASATVAYGTRYFNTNWSEQDPADWWRAVCDSTRSLASAVDPAEIAAICFSGQMMGCLCVDRGGRPLRPAILYSDQRSVEQCAAILEKIDARDFYRIVGHRASASYSATKLMWVRDHEPEVYAGTFKMLHAIGIELRQNYASTEAGFISSHSQGEILFESVGRPALGAEVRLTNEGELLIRSDCMFTGYYREPLKTAESFREGWYCTGDAVNINQAGHLIFLDRLKDMGELASGAKYAPQYIEGRLRFSPYIRDAMVIGGKDRDFVATIINIDFAMVSKWAQKHHLNYTTFVDLSQKAEVAELVARDLKRVNSYLPEASRVRRFVLLHKEFDADEAELTRTRKLRRGFMQERYKDLIDAIYEGNREVRVEAPVTYRDGRKGVVTTGIKVRKLEGEG